MCTASCEIGISRRRTLSAMCPNRHTRGCKRERRSAGRSRRTRLIIISLTKLRSRHETGFASIGQDNFGLVPFDATNIFAPGLAPPGTFNIQVTPQQAAFLGSPGLPPALLQQYAFLVGGSSAIALNGSYPQSFGLLAQLGAIPAPTNGTSPLTQFPSSCNPGNTLCNGLPASFQTLNAQVGNFPVFRGHEPLLAANRSQCERQ